VNNFKKKNDSMATASLILGILCLLIIVCLIVFAAFGWCFNIYGLFQCDFAAPYKAEIIRSIGIVVPFVGAIAGWCEIADGPVPVQVEFVDPRILDKHE
jgi:ABC-type multidrug transport system permease subunit